MPLTSWVPTRRRTRGRERVGPAGAGPVRSVAATRPVRRSAGTASGTRTVLPVGPPSTQPAGRVAVPIENAARGPNAIGRGPWAAARTGRIFPVGPGSASPTGWVAVPVMRQHRRGQAGEAHDGRQKGRGDRSDRHGSSLRLSHPVPVPRSSEPTPAVLQPRKRFRRNRDPSSGLHGPALDAHGRLLDGLGAGRMGVAGAGEVF